MTQLHPTTPLAPTFVPNLSAHPLHAVETPDWLMGAVPSVVVALFAAAALFV